MKKLFLLLIPFIFLVVSCDLNFEPDMTRKTITVDVDKSVTLPFFEMNINYDESWYPDDNYDLILYPTTIEIYKSSRHFDITLTEKSTGDKYKISSTTIIDYDNWTIEYNNKYSSTFKYRINTKPITKK